MRIRWFGEPWPSADERAPICDDDAYRVAAPTDVACLDCREPIIEGERGIVMGFGPPEQPGVSFWLELGDPRTGAARLALACASHIDCHVRTTAGPGYAHLIPRLP